MNTLNDENDKMYDKQMEIRLKYHLVVKKHNVVLDGHHRIQALKELGGVRIPCIEIP